jgi:hypothetical protein
VISQRVFMLIDPNAFEACFMAWVKGITPLGEHEVGAMSFPDNGDLGRYGCRSRWSLSPAPPQFHALALEAQPPCLNGESRLVLSRLSAIDDHGMSNCEGCCI